MVTIRCIMILGSVPHSTDWQLSQLSDIDIEIVVTSLTGSMREFLSWRH